MLRLNYKPTHWEDRVIDDFNGNVIVEGTPVDETNMNNIEEGIKTGHSEVGLTTVLALQMARHNQMELDAFKKQKLLQGRGTILNSINDDGYFRTSEPFKTVSIDGFPQINAPNYDVLLTPVAADDLGAIGMLEAYDKTQNGFKVKMTGSAKTVSFLWTLINPNV